MAKRKTSKKKKKRTSRKAGGRRQGLTITAMAPDLVETIRLREALQRDFDELQARVEDAMEYHQDSTRVRRLRVPLTRVQTRVEALAYGLYVRRSASSRKK